MRDTSKLPDAGPVALALIAELIVIMSIFGGMVWIVAGMPTP